MNERLVTLTQPHFNQQKIINEAKRYNVLCCGRRFGKSALAVNLLSELAIEGWPVGYFAPTYKLLDGTFKECSVALSHITKRKHEHQFIELITGGIIDFWSLDNELAGRSKKYKRVIVDESAFIGNLGEAWNESIRPTLTDLEGDAWFMSTPKGKNDFFKFYTKAAQGDEGWKSWHMTSYDNPFLKVSEIDAAKAGMPELAFNQEYLASFNDNKSNPFGINHIQQCVFPISTQPPVCFGIDLAKSSDWTVIIGLDKNGNVCYFDRFQKDWRSTVQSIMLLPVVPVKVDSTGVGDPIAEELQNKRPNVTGFKFTSWSKQQIMEGLAMSIQQRKISFPEGLIKDELENFEYQYTKSGVRYAAPEGLHDDCVCALALANDCLKTSVTFGNYSWA